MHNAQFFLMHDARLTFSAKPIVHRELCIVHYGRSPMVYCESEQRGGVGAVGVE